MIGSNDANWIVTSPWASKYAISVQSHDPIGIDGRNHMLPSILLPEIIYI